jgi:hypothetical protein
MRDVSLYDPATDHWQKIAPLPSPHDHLKIDFRTAASYRFWLSIGLALLFIPINTVSRRQRGGERRGTDGRHLPTCSH